VDLAVDAASGLSLCSAGLAIGTLLARKLSRAKALVKFSRYRAAQEAAPEENWI
jgi:hypothetical protein